jgi:hypothetical protein
METVRMGDDDSTTALAAGFRRSGLTTTGVWLRAMGIGGDLRQSDVAALTTGGRLATRAEHDLVAAALNEHFVELGQNHPVPYWAELGRSA